LNNRPNLDDASISEVEEWFVGFEAELRLFIAIHENEGHKISPKLLRKEVLAE